MNRKMAIRGLKNKRYTLQQIGDLFGITRQRVHQILNEPTKIKKLKRHKKKWDRRAYYKQLFEKKEKEKDTLREYFDNRCQVCGKHQKREKRRLAMHHLDQNKQNNNIKNLMVLCSQCHTLIHCNKT